MVKAVRKGLAFALGLAFAPALAVPAAQAQTGDPLLSSVLSTLGLTAPDKPDINYRDRPPLVVPPRSTLPPPQEGRRSAGNWPNDPDSAENRRARSAAAAADMETRIRRNDTGSRIDGADMNRRGGRAVAANPASSGSETYQFLDVMAQDARRASQTAEVPVGTEPPRRFLTEPPTGLRASTARVKATTEVVERDEDRSTARTFIDQQIAR
ncbi:MAG: hypothetical protein ACOVN4_11100 [Bosea sp. (in: a-proteobacteria)]|jgi:hypothetical protein